MVGGQIPACQYTAVAKGGGAQIARVPADEWIQAVPSILSQLEQIPTFADDPEMQRRMEDAITILEDGGPPDADQACEIFSLMAALNGTPPGSKVSIAYLPTEEAAQGLSAQGCDKGSYASVLVLKEAGMEPSAETEAAIMDLITSLLVTGGK